MKKVLVVDDMDSWRQFNKNMLTKLYGNAIITDTAASAKQAYDLIMKNLKVPYEIIITDLQMENDYAPKLAGEWLVEQIQMFYEYKQTQIIIISAAYNIQIIAELLGVKYIPKSAAIHCASAYTEILGIA